MKTLQLAALSLLLATPAVLSQATISNGDITLAFTEDAVAKTLTLNSIGDASDPTAVLLRGDDLWEIELQAQAGPPVIITPSSAATAAFSATTAPMNGNFLASWLDATTTGMNGEAIDVSAFFKIGANSKSCEAQIFVDTTGTSFAITRVRFPNVEFRADEFSLGSPGVPTATSSPALTVPYGGGLLIRDPLNAPLSFFDPAAPGLNASANPGYMSMQWLSFYDESLSQSAGPVFTFGTRDGDPPPGGPTAPDGMGFYKEYVLGTADDGSGVTDAVTFAVDQYPANSPVAQVYVSPYPVTLGLVRGDWYDAAMDYKQWAVEQAWAAKGPMSASADFSPRIRDAAMFGLFRAGADDDPPPGTNCTGSDSPKDVGSFMYWQRDLDEQLLYFDVPDMPMVVYDWDHNAFDANAGEYYPVVATFDVAASTLAGLGHAFAPYFNPVIYSKTGPAYNSGGLVAGFTDSVGNYALVEQDGSVEEFSWDYCDATTHALTTADIVRLDLSTDFAGAYTEQYALELQADHGASGVYLDVFSHGSTLCYAASHGHAPGGGSFYGEGKRAAMEALRTEARTFDPEYFTMTESESELYLDQFEWTFSSLSNAPALLSANTFRAPLFQTVYHEYRVSTVFTAFHSPDLLETEINPPLQAWNDPALLRAFRRFLAENLHFGHAPMAGSSLDEMSFSSSLSTWPLFEKIAVQLRRYMGVLRLPTALEPLRLGQRLRDPITDAPVVPFEAGVFESHDEPPAVYTSAWFNPSDGSVSILLLNWTDPSDVVGAFQGGPMNITFEFDLADYGLTPGNYTRQETNAAGAQPSTTVTMTGPTYSEVARVKARNVRFLRFTPD